jgi:hypothetical protein
MRHKNFLPFGVAFMFGAMGLSCLEHELWGVIIAHLVWLPLFVGLQTHYDEVVVLTTIEANTHTYHLKTVARSFVMAMCIIPIALMASHSRYGWLALGTDYLWLWFLVFTIASVSLICLCFYTFKRVVTRFSLQRNMLFTLIGALFVN